MSIDKADLLDRFCRYVQINTRSDPDSPSTPSTPGQWDLLRLLESELKAFGAHDVRLTEFGYLLATIPATTAKTTVPKIAFFAHVDTEQNLPGAAKPIVHRNYDGRPIVLPDDPAQVLDPARFPALKEKKGDDIITASGTTLLGADDKAGVAAVMSVARHLLANPSIPHGEIRVCFNPDEEIARGVEKLDLADVAVDFAYTLDSELPGEIDYESFSADAAVVDIRGVASHPGWAKDVMVNAIRIAGRFVAALPMEISPERTAGRDGFIHPTGITGNLERAQVKLILRDFELDGLEAKRAVLRGIVAKLQKDEPHAEIKLEITKQYRNMRYWLEKDMRPVDFALEAVRRAGLEPISHAIRGGTDGSRLTERGLPTPNIFCGMRNVHSQLEWVSLQDMAAGAETVLHLAQLWEERS
ncbi:MAG TPA: peptidase T [Opitutaceae bacterium]|nr:peptidase T [Opitutaceae bacterium]